MMKLKAKYQIKIKMKDICAIRTCTGKQNTKLLLQLQLVLHITTTGSTILKDI